MADQWGIKAFSHKNNGVSSGTCTRDEHGLPQRHRRETEKHASGGQGLSPCTPGSRMFPTLVPRVNHIR